MNRVLVTGGAGFIGSNFIRYLLRKHPRVRVTNLDALTYAGSEENLYDLPAPGRHIFIKGDIRDRELVQDIFKNHRIDTVVHLAAESHVDRSILAPSHFIETNIIGTFTLLECARSAWKDWTGADFAGMRFHHVSTDEVYGSLGSADPPFSERTRYAPNSPYAASKASSDHLVRAYFQTYGLPVTISNCSNNYGPNQFPEKLIPLMILNALAGNPLPIYGDGQQVRDWLYVEDHCEAICSVLENGRLGEVYNVGGENQPTNMELVRSICDDLDRRFPDSPARPHWNLITHVEDRPGHDRRYAMDTGKIRSELGWEPRHSLEEGLRKTIDWYLANPAWLRAVGNRPSYDEWLELNYGHREKIL